MSSAATHGRCASPLVNHLRGAVKSAGERLPSCSAASVVRQAAPAVPEEGDPFVCQLLVQSAHYILGPFGPDCDLRRHGLKLTERGGKAAKKRAAVAVARKLAVLLHRLWLTQQRYEPFRESARPAA